MSRSITVLVTTTSENPKTAGLEIRVGATTWEKFEPGGVDDVFKIKRGNYTFKGSGGTGTTELVRPGGGKRAGALYNFNPDSVTEGDTGQGLSDDAGSGLTWKADKIINI